MFASLRDRPWLAALLIAIAAQALFTLHLGRPSKLTFDEVHYVPAARALLDLSGPVNTEHPLLGKLLIASGIALFGDGPIGWRAMSTIAGTATVIGSFAVLMLLLGNVRTAAFGALCVLVNQTVFVQARIGMLDGFLGAFVVATIAALIWSAQAPPGHIWRRLILAAVLAGCAVAVKWAAIPYVALACLGIVWTRWHGGAGLLTGRGQPHWPGVRTADLLLGFGLIAIAAYLASFAPAFFYARDPLTLAGLVPFQFDMLAAQTQVLSPHSYQSDWWSWPLMLRPIWYFYEPDQGAVRGVLLIGNPAVMWAGLAAVAACWAAARHSPAHLLIAMLWTFSLLIFAIIPKSLGFYYYYHLSGIFVALALAAAAHRWRARWPHADLIFGTLAVGLFAYFYPILSAAPLPGDQAFTVWTWFPGWR
ncbi:phospholipid carrier-dependent glycosyltransferase [Sphingomonas japonica]|uniref:Polyprenol-phosphate-mannose--protein mannosyltransferase n=1 Tax=Sphingomonas japonica TaxID=511662 RepID=A0ABX0U1E8_9SPHN|nr:phospholipid carrier-dependent glycosyltransferase [Sphingomonas japonica]NIJ24389.1 dolichyl-phosphate-mannose--protein O-mannosyl transferase [Sphingomonas japonica]